MSTMFYGKGNLGAAPVLKQIQGANGPFQVASMRVMFARYKQDDAGDIEQAGGFWREVEIYGAKAKACAELLKKGARVAVMGDEREYTGKDDKGTEHQLFKIVAEDITLVLSRIESITFAASREPAAAAA